MSRVGDGGPSRPHTRPYTTSVRLAAPESCTVDGQE